MYSQNTRLEASLSAGVPQTTASDRFANSKKRRETAGRPIMEVTPARRAGCQARSARESEYKSLPFGANHKADGASIVASYLCGAGRTRIPVPCCLMLVQAISRRNLGIKIQPMSQARAASIGRYMLIRIGGCVSGAACLFCPTSAVAAPPDFVSEPFVTVTVKMNLASTVV